MFLGISEIQNERDCEPGAAGGRGLPEGDPGGKHEEPEPSIYRYRATMKNHSLVVSVLEICPRNRGMSKQSKNKKILAMARHPGRSF